MRIGLALVTILAATSAAMAQPETPDFRIRAKLKTPNNGVWPSNESLGSGDFRVQSRFMQVYYGGVHRSDEFKFGVQLDFRDASGFATNFPTSVYNTNYDCYINGAFVGRAIMGQSDFGNAEFSYDSRHPEFPTLPLPAAFPDPVGAGDVLDVYFAAAGAQPAIGSAPPAGPALMSSVFGEEFARGDVNQDRKVDNLDFAFLASTYDPFLAGGVHFGPTAGDFTGDNLATAADYDLFVANWTENDPAPARPAPAFPGCAVDYNQDGNVDQDDIAYLIAVVSGQPNTTGIDPDLNQDGNVDQSDVAMLIGAVAGAPCN